MDVKEEWVGLALIKIWRVYEKRLDLGVSVKNAGKWINTREFGGLTSVQLPL